MSKEVRILKTGIEIIGHGAEAMWERRMEKLVKRMKQSFACKLCESRHH